MNNAIEVLHNTKAKHFHVTLGDQRAVLQYTQRGTDMYITHTYVPPAYEAQNIAAAMTERALNFARDNGFTVHPLCRYTAVYIRRHKEYQSLLAQTKVD